LIGPSGSFASHIAVSGPPRCRRRHSVDFDVDRDGAGGQPGPAVRYRDTNTTNNHYIYHPAGTPYG
jgi:hypothetical protein